jgi:glucose/arabinose dehydrogenase
MQGDARRWAGWIAAMGGGVTAAAGCADDAAPAVPPVVAAVAPHDGDAADGPADLPMVRLAPAFPRLTFERPVLLTHAGDGSNRLFVIEQPGRIRVLENRSAVDSAGVFLDLESRVRMRHNEEGLLALAFHPKYAQNGHFYVFYSASNPLRGVLSRFSVSRDDPLVADPDSETVLLDIPKPYGNHNGATVIFGPDGFLYFSIGDGGLANDPHNNGQDLSTLLGDIMRIDVDREEGGRRYAIPADNPFVGRAGARPEIWACGLRNIWRMSFDPATGELWAGDVGQNRYEEIDLIVRGGNYGWRIREGAHPFRTDQTAVDPLIDPVIEYGRDEGISVTGGHVYRGSRIPALAGAYVYADYVSGRIWALRHRDGKVVAHRRVVQEARPGIASFGEDAARELYLCVFDRVDGSRGRLFTIAPE